MVIENNLIYETMIFLDDLSHWLISGNLKNFENNAHIDGLVQERRNSSALATEFHLSCTNQSIFAALFNPLNVGAALTGLQDLMRRLT